MVNYNQLIRLKLKLLLMPYISFYLFCLRLFFDLFKTIAKDLALMSQVCYRFFEVFDKTIVAIVSCASVIVFV